MKIVEEPIGEYKSIIKLILAEYISGYKLRLNFNDGQENIVDFEPFLSKSLHPSIRKYLNLDNFKKFRIINGNLNWNDYDLIFPISNLKQGVIT